MTGEAATQTDSASAARRRTAWAWTGAGYAFFAIGVLGIVLPVLPTTIFWIVAAACFARGCPAMARRIYRWPGIGPSVEAFLSEGVIARRGKLAAIFGIALAGGIVALSPLPLGAMLVTLAVMALAGLYVASRPEIRNSAKPASGE